MLLLCYCGILLALLFQSRAILLHYEINIASWTTEHRENEQEQDSWLSPSYADRQIQKDVLLSPLFRTSLKISIIIFPLFQLRCAIFIRHFNGILFAFCSKMMMMIMNMTLSGQRYPSTFQYWIYNI